jgi:hypothetical protein
MKLVGIVLVIVKLDAVHSFIPFGVAPAFGANGAAHDLIGQAIIGGAEDLGDGDAVPLLGRMIQKRTQAFSVEFGRCQLGEVGERWVEVDELDNSCTCLPVSFGPGGADDERSADAFFEQAAFLPDAKVFTKMIAVVTPKNDDGIVGEVEPVKAVKNTAY